jgi:hypothetical protein
MFDFGMRYKVGNFPKRPVMEKKRPTIVGKETYYRRKREGEKTYYRR